MMQRLDTGAADFEQRLSELSDRQGDLDQSVSSLV